MFKKDQGETNLDQAIDTVLEAMSQDKPDSESYAKLVDQLTKLYAIKNENRGIKGNWATIGANLGGLLLILNHERAGAVTSKALGFIQKLK